MVIKPGGNAQCRAAPRIAAERRRRKGYCRNTNGRFAAQSSHGTFKSWWNEDPVLRQITLCSKLCRVAERKLTAVRARRQLLGGGIFQMPSAQCQCRRKC